MHPDDPLGVNMYLQLLHKRDCNYLPRPCPYYICKIFLRNVPYLISAMCDLLHLLHLQMTIIH